MSRLPKTCTLNWDPLLEQYARAYGENSTEFKREVKAAVRKKYKHCFARGTTPTISTYIYDRWIYRPSSYVKISNIIWGRPMSSTELGLPKLVKKTYIHNKHIEDATAANVKRYLRTKYRHYIAKGTKLEIKPFGILTEVSNIKWGRMLASTEE